MVNLYHHPYAVRGIRILDSRMAIEYFTNYTITAKKNVFKLSWHPDSNQGHERLQLSALATELCQDLLYVVANI